MSNKLLIKVSAWWTDKFYARKGSAENTVNYYNDPRSAYKAASRIKRNGATNVFIHVADARLRTIRRVEIG